MAVQVYTFALQGRSADSLKWEISARVKCEWKDVFDVVMRRICDDMTNGTMACNGPYTIWRMTIALEADDSVN